MGTSSISQFISQNKGNKTKKINKLDLIKLKSFVTATQAINKTKRRSTEWETKFANDVNNKELISNICKQLIHLNTKKENLKRAELNRHFSKKEVQMAKRHMKRCLISLTIMKMKIRITMGYHLTPVRMTIVKKNTNNKGWQECAENGMLAGM